MYKYLLFVILFFSSSIECEAGYYSASLTFNHVGGRTYEINLHAFLDVNIHSYVPISIGNDTDTLFLVSQINTDNLIEGFYQGNYTFSDDGLYSILIELHNRAGGVLNIPGSVNTPFSITGELLVDDFLGGNNSAVCSFPLVDTASVNEPYLADLSAIDMDGDSLSYLLLPCRGGGGSPMPFSTFPDEPPFFELDNISGLLTWNVPQFYGKYGVMIRTEEWRSGNLISFMEREMLIVVDFANEIENNIPEFSNEVKVFPNPSSEYITIKLNNSQVKISQIELFNSAGKRVFFDSKIQHSETAIDVRESKSGVYFYRILSSWDDNYLGKFIVD